MKKKNLALTIIVALLAVILVGCLAACNEKPDIVPDDDIETPGEDGGDTGEKPVQKEVTVNAHAEMTYGDSSYEWVYTFEGAPEGATLESLGLEGKVDVDDRYIPATSSLEAKVYDQGKIKIDRGSDTDEYKFKKGTAILTVSPRPVTVTVGSQTVSYDPNGITPVMDGSVGIKTEGIASGHALTSIALKTESAVVNAGDSSAIVYDADAENSIVIKKGALNVTANYSVTVKVDEDAKLTVIKAKPIVDIFVGKKYDGEATNFNAYDTAVKDIIEAAGYTEYTIIDTTAANTQHSAAGGYPVQVKLEGNNNYEEQTVTAYLGIRTFVDSEGNWYSIPEASAIAAREPFTIMMAMDTTITSDTVIGKDLTVVLREIKSTNTSADHDISSEVAKPTYANYKEHAVQADKKAEYIESTMTVVQGAQLTIEGNIIVSGLLSRQDQGIQGHTSGNHSVLAVAGDVIVADGGVLDVRGYVRGEGKVTVVKGGRIYTPFTVYDFKGGTATAGLYQGGNVSPFNLFDIFYNLQADTRVEYGSTVTSYLSLWAASRYNTTMADLVGEGNSFFSLSDGAALEISWEKSDDYSMASGRNKIVFLGDVTLGDISLTINAIITTVTVNLSDVRVPISQRFDWQVGDGTTESSLTMPDEYKLLPGSKLVVSENATLVVENSLVAYSVFEETNFASLGSYPFKDRPELIVNGKLVFADGASFGGQIKSETSGAQVVTGASFTAKVNSVEGVGTGIESFMKTFDITEYARFDEGKLTRDEKVDSGNASYKDLIYKEYSSDNPIEANATYTYNAETATWTKA